MTEPVIQYGDPIMFVIDNLPKAEDRLRKCANRVEVLRQLFELKAEHENNTAFDEGMACLNGDLSKNLWKIIEILGRVQVQAKRCKSIWRAK